MWQIYTAEKARKIQRILNAREKSLNERILEDFEEEARQEAIKQQVAELNQQRSNELFMGRFSPSRNIFIGHRNILESDLHHFRSEGNILRGGSILNQENLFFK